MRLIVMTVLLGAWVGLMTLITAALPQLGLLPTIVLAPASVWVGYTVSNWTRPLQRNRKRNDPGRFIA